MLLVLDPFMRHVFMGLFNFSHVCVSNPTTLVVHEYVMVNEPDDATSEHTSAQDQTYH